MHKFDYRVEEKMLIDLIMDKIYKAFTTIFVKIDHVGPVETGKVNGNFFVVRTGTANFYIYESEGNFICFDSGFGKRQIIRELGKLGIEPDDITHLFLTHSDFDHAGGVSLFKKAEIYLSGDEEQMITGKKARKFGFIYNARIKRRYNLLKDNEVITIGKTKVKAIATPGHTPGSMSYLINDSILIVGDAFRLYNGKVYPIKYYNYDTNKQKESIKKLSCIDNVQMVCTAHRGYSEKFHEAISDWR